jgi:hypothetical protein
VELCPSHALTSSMGSRTPHVPMSRCDAQVWRRSWNRTRRVIPARRR